MDFRIESKQKFLNPHFLTLFFVDISRLGLPLNRQREEIAKVDLLS